MIAPGMPIASSIAAASVAPTRVDSAFAGAFDAERVEWVWGFLAQNDFDVRHVVRRWHQVVRQRRRQRIALIAVGKLLQ